jgi:hypothetical protein
MRCECENGFALPALFQVANRRKEKQTEGYESRRRIIKLVM